MGCPGNTLPCPANTLPKGRSGGCSGAHVSLEPQMTGPGIPGMPCIMHLMATGLLSASI